MEYPKGKPCSDVHYDNYVPYANDHAKHTQKLYDIFILPKVIIWIPTAALDFFGKREGQELWMWLQI